MIFRTVAGAPEEDSLKGYVPAFDASLSWATVKPLIEEAEMEFLRPALGAYLDTLQAAFDAYPATPMPAAEASALRLAQRTVAHFARYNYLRSMGIRLANMGPVESSSQEGTAMMPRQWVHKGALIQAFAAGHTWLNHLLNHLLRSAVAYPDWVADPAYLYADGNIFATADQISEYLASPISRVVFLRLKPVLAQAERRLLRPLLGNAFFTEIKQALADQPGTPLPASTEALLPYLRDALASWAMARALPYVRLQIGANGMIEPDYDDGVMVGQKASEEVARSLWLEADQAAREFGRALIAFLNQQGDTYPTWAESPYYDPPPDDPEDIAPPGPYDPVWL